MTSYQPGAPASAPSHVTITAGGAFKIGFFGALGVFVCSLIPWAIFIVLALVLGIGGAFSSLPILNR